MSRQGVSKASKQTAEPKRAMSPLEEYEYLVAQVIRAAEETGPLVSHDSATQKRIAQCAGEQLSSEGFGSPTAVSVPEALAWLLPGLEAVVARMPKGSRPGLALA